MPKKLLMGLAPALVVAAFAAMPVAAQAEPHYYKSGALIAEGEKVPIIEWGTFSGFFFSISPTTTCEYVVGGYVENPVGGGAGIGQTTAFSTFNCTNVNCPPGKVTIEGKEYEKEMTVTGGRLPWPSVLIEEEVIKTENKGLQWYIGCVAQSSLANPAGPGSPGGQEPIYLSSPAVCEPPAESGQRFLNEPGRNTTITSKLVTVNAPTFFRCGGGAEWWMHGKLKVIGYKESELITTK